MNDLVLGIETSCDETAAALVDSSNVVLSSVVSSQIDLHARYGGVVPELAGRAHLDRILPVVAESFAQAGLGEPSGVKLRAVVATMGPGLVGSLLVGLAAAKSLALAWDVPFVGVNHLEGHLYAAFLEHGHVELPLVVMLVSGGHTLTVGLSAPGRYDILGETVDDAAGEAFDKVARFLHLSYPGGPAIQRIAESGDEEAIAFPRPMLGVGLDFSFSGLKTAVIHHVRAHPEVTDADVAASFQAAVVEVLVTKALSAAEAISAKGVCLAGGVAANGPLRRATAAACERAGLACYVPSLAMCTDNAAMIAAAGHAILERSGPSSLDIDAQPNLRLAPRR